MRSKDRDDNDDEDHFFSIVMLLHCVSKKFPPLNCL